MLPALSLAAALAVAVSTAPAGPGSVNRIIGDASWLAAYGRPPGPADSEDDRIRAHLAFVESWLRTHEPAGLAAPLRAERARNLDRLHAYWTAGVFPRNDGHPDPRRPTFIDAAGHICAVGYLVEESAGRALAEEVARADRYGYLEEMKIPALDAWAAGSGLTKHELAMIQPSYEWLRKNAGAPTAEELATAVRGISAATDLCFYGAVPDRGFDGVVSIDVLVQPDGALTKAIVRHDGDARGLSACLTARLLEIRFDAFEGAPTRVNGTIAPPARLAPDGRLSDLWVAGVVRAAEPRFAKCLGGLAARVTFTVDPKSGAIRAEPAVKLWKHETVSHSARATACVTKELRALRFGAYAGAPVGLFVFVPFDDADIYEHKD
jgi:hypothetical protein